MSDLYRIAKRDKTTDHPAKRLTTTLAYEAGALMELVPVERCIHSKIDGHYYSHPHEGRLWCDGAGLGGNE
jgi:hypothetical protein